MKEYKAVQFQLEDSDEQGGEFSGYAAVFGNVDSGGDVIEPGAFVKTLEAGLDRIKILSQHNDCSLPIGKPLELREDEKGLYIRAKISDTQAGRDVKTLLRDGVLGELSIGYEPVEAEVDEAGVRHLKEVKLWEVSVVTWAMNDQAKIESVKALRSDLEREMKGGKLTRGRINSLKPYVAVIQGLCDMLAQIMAEADTPPPEPPEPVPPDRSKAQATHRETKFIIVRGHKKTGGR